MFEIENYWLFFAIDISAKSLILSCTTWLAIRLFGVRDNNLRHRIWTVVLVGMLSLPFLTITVPTLGIGISVPYPWTSSFSGRAGVENRSNMSEESVVHLRDQDQTQMAVTIRESHPLSPDETYENRSAFNNSTLEFAPEQSVGIGSNHRQIPLPSELSAASRISWSEILFFIWLGGVGIMSTRLILGFAYSLRLSNSSRQIIGDEFEANGVGCTFRDKSDLQSFIYENLQVNSPVVIGFIYPRILLPVGWSCWSKDKLNSVLAHEHAHIQRADSFVALLAEMNRCLYWFHPVAWWLQRRIGYLAETACDDIAVKSIGNRATYARQLLEVASLGLGKQGRLAFVGISMARQSNIELRIDSILDRSRRLSNPTTWTTVLALFLLFIPLFAFASALRPLPLPSTTGESAQTGSKETGKDTEEATPLVRPSNLVGQDFKKSYSGTVTGSKGEPVAGAKVSLALTSYEFNSETNLENRSGILRQVATSGANGKFEFTLDESLAQEIQRRRRYAIANLCATTKGYGLDWMPLETFENNPSPSEVRNLQRTRIDKALGDGRFDSRNLVLPMAAQPITGKLVDLQGNPLPNVKVLIEKLDRPNIPMLLRALDLSWTQGFYESISSTSVFVRNLARSELQQLFPPVSTDENGRFEIQGIGDDQLATLIFKSDHVQSAPIYVFGRDMEKTNLPLSKIHPDGPQATFVGREFSHTLGPSIPLTGVVTDYENGFPVPGVLVFVNRLFQSTKNERLDTRHLRSVTDEQGRFLITGVPPGEGHVLEAVAPKSQPYFLTLKEFSLDPTNTDSQQIKMQIAKGIWIEGQVCDKTTGQPVQATVDYLALQQNPNSLEKKGLQREWIHQSRYKTDENGTYKIVGLPGPGVVLAKSERMNEYPLFSGAESIDGFDIAKRTIPTTPYPLPLRYNFWHVVKQITPAADANTHTCDISMDASLLVTGRVVGPDGDPIKDLVVLGQTTGDPYWRPQPAAPITTSDHFSVNGYDGKGPRNLFFKNQNQTLVGKFRLEGAAPKEILVKLEPAIRVTGRLIENDTNKPASLFFVFCEKYLAAKDKTDGDFAIHWCDTDENGNFEIKGLMAGYKYRMNSRLSTHKEDRNRFTIDLTNSKPGDLVELGDVVTSDRSE